VTHAGPISTSPDLTQAALNGHASGAPNFAPDVNSTQGAAAPAMSIAEVGPAAQKIVANIERVIAGKYDVIRLGVTVLLAEGHLLIEDVPGVGKTTFAKALARSIDCSVRRIQFTPDLLPSDVTGVSIYNAESTDFEFKPGPVFANIVLGDEINRASPKTQAALLECMAERQVTVDGTRYELQSPFLVLATQNPVEMEGTYALPEAQRDRFTAKISLGYPDRAAEIAMLSDQTTADPLDDLKTVSDAATIRTLIETVRTVHVVEAVKDYVVALAEATRKSPELRLGASPRASLHLLRTAKALAAMAGRDFVLPDDVQRLAVPVLAHRLIPASSATVAGRSPEAIVAEIVAKVPIPVTTPRA
jgi:MoxR-like ATPase